jgi:AcrR family transcriptional regulator
MPPDAPSVAEQRDPLYPVPPELPEPEPPTSRRAWGKIPYEERFRQQHRELLDAAATLAAERGVAGTSVASITAHAGLAKRVFYEHFADKDACFAELLRQMGAARIRAASAAAEDATGEGPLAVMTAVIRALVDRRRADPRLLAAIRADAVPASTRTGASAELRSQIADLLVAVALRLGSQLPEHTIRLAALLLVNGVVDLGAELRGRRDALRELATIACLAFGLSPEVRPE